MRMNLVFEKNYYCDLPPHEGMQYVQLHGYLTQQQLKLLEELIASGGTPL
jgi:hypothetical protein